MQPRHYLLSFALLAASLYGAQAVRDLTLTGNSTLSGNITSNATITGGTLANATLANATISSATISSATLTTATAPASTNLTLAGGSSGASVVLGQGSAGNIVITPKSDGAAEFMQVMPSLTANQTTNIYGLRTQYTLAQPGTTENITWANGAILGEINVESTNQHSYSNRQTGLYAYINHHGAGQMGLPIGVWSVVAGRGAGGMGSARAFDAHMFTEDIAGTGAVTSMTGYHARSVTATGGTVGTIYGLYIDEQTAASTNWGVYTAGATPSYFGGNLTVAGNLTVSGTGFQSIDGNLRLAISNDKNVDLGDDARASNVGLRINSAAGRLRYFQFQSGGSPRWMIGVSNSGESTGDAGSDLFVLPYDDAGAGKTNALAISRATNAVTLGGTVATAAPTGGAGAWKLGVANTVSPTSPNRTITIEIGGVTYYLAAKTTND